MAATATVIASSPALADTRGSERRRIDISAGQLTAALAELAREAGVSIGTEGSLPPRRTRAVKGTMDIDTALARLLAGSGYTARRVGPTAWRIEPVRPASPAARPRLAGGVPGAPPGEPIIITGSKRRTAISALPIALAAVRLSSEDPVRQSPAAGTTAIASEIEGLSVTALGSGRNRLFLRGVADSPFNGESQATVAVVLDEARLTYAAPDPDVALVDIERVEVLKGPQGALYGTGALGGIYHLVSRRARLGENSLDASSDGEFVAHGAAGFSVSAVANLALAPDRLALRLVGYQREQSGWIDTGTRKDGNSERLSGVRAGLGVDPGGGWRLDATGFAQWRDADDSHYVYAEGARSRPAQEPEPHDNDLRHASVRLAREGGPTDIVLSSGITWHEVRDVYDAAVGAESFGLDDPRTLEADRHYRVWDNEIRFSGDAGAVQWLAGASALQVRQESVWTLDGASSARTVDRNDRDTTDLALFGDVTVPLFDSISLDAGARLFRSEVGQIHADDARVERRDLTRTGITPAFALSWRPDSSRLAFARYGSALRQGGLATDASGAPGPLEGDELATLELGWRQELAGSGRLDLGVYRTTWENLQSDMLQANGLTAPRNAGDARIEGIDASFESGIGDGWTITLGGTLQRARLVRNDLGIELDDRRLPTIPDYLARASVLHRFAVGAADASLRLKLRYVGPARLSFDPQADRPMGDYLESGLEGRLAIGTVALVMTLDNLLQRQGDEFPFGNPLRFATMRQYTPQRPFSGSIGLRAAF